MGTIDFDKFLASFITAMKECSRMRTFSIPICIKKALEDQGLEYKDGEIVKTQRRISAEAKENGYGESEDERIRKEIIAILQYKYEKFPKDPKYCNAPQWIAWLEKQGNPNKEYWRGYKDGKKAILDKYSELKKPTEWSKEDIGIIEGMIIDYRGEIEHLSNSIIDEQAKPIYQERIDFLNRLKTCCPELYNVQKKIDNAIYLIEHYATHGHDKNLRNKVIDELEYVKHELEKQGEQNHSEQDLEMVAKPKFNIGDWITSDEGYINDDFRPCKIVGISDGCYTIQTINGYGGYNTFKMWESEYRLWSIADAKPGDVLIDHCDDYKNPLIFILKKFERVDFGLAQKSDYSSYCFLTAGDKQRFKEGTYHHKHNIKPATKEQRDLLFQKMREAGYIFDFEKKELKKLKFKVGDEVIPENEESLTITRIDEEGYWSNDLFICDFDSECICELVEKKPIEWKPSSEQLYFLHWLATNVLTDGEVDKKASEILNTLYDDLKKL